MHLWVFVYLDEGDIGVFSFTGSVTFIKIIFFGNCTYNIWFLVTGISVAVFNFGYLLVYFPDLFTSPRSIGVSSGGVT